MNDEIREFCPKCSNPLEDGQDFCPKCGTKKAVPEMITCRECGAVLQKDQGFCPKCGHRASPAADVPAAAATGGIGTGNVKKIVKFVLVPVFAVLAVALIIFTVSGLFPNTEKLLAAGKYEQAYNAAPPSDKDRILMENIAATVSSKSANSLKDRSSFELREAWFGDDCSRVVLEVGGKNAYGGIVTNYWYYTYDEDKEEFSLFTTYTSLEEEKENSWDDDDTKLEKLLKNIFLITVKNIIRDGEKLPKSSVKNINSLFERDLLEDVGLIRAVYLRMPSDS